MMLSTKRDSNSHILLGSPAQDFMDSAVYHFGIDAFVGFCYHQHPTNCVGYDPNGLVHIMCSTSTIPGQGLV